MSFLFSPNPNIQQQALLLQFRQRIFPWILLTTALLAILYLIPWAIGWIDHALLPYDGLFLIGLSAVCYLLSRLPRLGLPTAASLFIAGFSQPFFFATQTFGVNAPTTAVFILSILLCGLLIGGWFLNAWIGFHTLWVILIALLEYNGRYTPPNPISSLPQLVSSAIFWSVLLIVSGMLIRFIIRQLEQSLQVATGQATAISRTFNAITSEHSLKSMVREGLKTTGEQLGVEGITLFLHNQEEEILQPYLHYVNNKIVEPAEVANPLPPMPANQSPIWHSLRENRQTIIITDLANDPRILFRARIIAEGLKKAMYVPLLMPERTLGWLNINSCNSAPFWPEDIQLAELLAKQITLSIRLNELAQEAATQASQTAVFSERNRMAGEIHDNLAQGFTGIVVQLEAADDMLATEPDAAREHIQRAQALAKHSLDEARRSVWDLRPKALESNDLPQAIERMLSRLTPGTLVTSQQQTVGTYRPFPPATESELLRIAQEAVTNALKHAKASKIKVQLDYRQPDLFKMIIEDNGRGFDPLQPNAGFGLTSMRERAMKINGRLSVNMRLNGGTEVVCLISQPTTETTKGTI